MNSELNLIFLAVMITCAAFVGAVNSKGTSKMIISYILAFVCLAVSGFKITKYATSATRERNLQIAEEVGKKIEDKLEILEEKEAGLKDEEQNELIAKYKREAGKLVENMKRLNGRISNFI